VTPEEMPVNETLELRGALKERMGVDISLVVANGVAPDRFSTTEARALEAAAVDAEGPVRAALWSHARAQAQRGQLRRLRAGLDERPVRLPFLFAPELGPDELGALADLLERAL
jgi:hypothetical protein